MLHSLQTLGDNLQTLIQKEGVTVNLLKYKQLLEKYQGDDWKQFIKKNNKTYQRIKVYDCEYFDMYIITWLQNQESKIHNHAPQGCLNKILLGKLNETIYDKSFMIKSHNLQKTQNISYIDDSIGYHKIKNNQSLSVSLHIYSPPNFKTKYFN